MVSVSNGVCMVSVSNLQPSAHAAAFAPAPSAPAAAAAAMFLPKQIKTMGTRDKSAELDFSGVLEQEVEEALKAAAQISMGTEISEEDLSNIMALCDQV
jgi:nucleolar protein 58